MLFPKSHPPATQKAIPRKQNHNKEIVKLLKIQKEQNPLFIENSFRAIYSALFTTSPPKTIHRQKQTVANSKAIVFHWEAKK